MSINLWHAKYWQSSAYSGPVLARLTENTVRLALIEATSFHQSV